MKLSTLQKYLDEKSINVAIFIGSDPSIVYFTQTFFSHAIMAITPNKVKVFISKLDQPPEIKGIKFTELNHKWSDEIFEISKIKPSIKKIGINKFSLTVKDLENLKEKFPKAEFVDLSKKINNLRREKTSSEIKNQEKACQITTEAFNKVVEELPKGNLRTEQGVASFLESKIRQQGAKLAFPTIVACGKNAATPHHLTSNEELCEGFLLMDFGAKYKNYCADMTRIIFLGTARDEDKEIYNLLLNAQKEAINSIKEGISFVDLDQQVRKNLGKYGKNFIHSLGHGIGVEVHEEPVFSNKNSKVEKNVPFTIEPGIYLAGKLGLRIEDTVIFDEKVRVLTDAPKNLIEINWK